MYSVATETNGIAETSSSNHGISLSTNEIIKQNSTIYSHAHTNINVKNCNDTNKIGISCTVSSIPENTDAFCENGGTLIMETKLSGTYWCNCTKNFGGSHCDKNIRPCELNACLYGGLFRFPLQDDLQT